jgi:triacylglycerol esterase/lipase EstA (alpha/beta hydrolase family)
MQTHWSLRAIPVGEGSQAEWALEPKGKAIVFVHGFKGAAVGTWLEFPTMLRQEPSAAGWDLIFYGYDGVRTRATNSANHLRTFLQQLFTDPLPVMNTTLDNEAQRPTTFSYEKVIIVAHSLGAVVSRQAILDAHLIHAPWVSRTGLILFAPAHLGAQILPLLMQTVTGLGGKFGAAATFFLKFRWRVLRDLEPGSNTLSIAERHSGCTWEWRRALPECASCSPR